MSPIIGITMHPSEGRQQINNSYIESIIQAGGIPLCIPIIQQGINEVLSKVDGLLLIGGYDVNPKYFDEHPHPKVGRIETNRDESDFALLQEALNLNMPVFAVCRGLQVLNVLFGGSLYQDIPSQVDGAMQHTQNSSRHEKVHAITVYEDTKLHSIVGEHIMTNSFHHQSVKALGEGLVISATTNDGIVEAIEHPNYTFCLGVQWHPEELAIHGDNPSKKLFEAFVTACK